MEDYIKITSLKDFEYCPRSVFYQKLYEANYQDKIFKSKEQIAGQISHQAIDNKKHSTRKEILQGTSVFSEQYKIAGKIDTFNIKTGELTERKTEIFLDKDGKEKIYLGQRYQLWGQMFCLEEMGYSVSQIYIYSIKTNKKYRIYKPRTKQLLDFENMLEKYRKFNPLEPNWKQNTQKCIRCIYRELCDYYIGEIYPQMKLFE